MPLFKKSTSEAGVMSDNHRKVLHRCRMILIKDMDVHEVLDVLVQEDIFKLEIREYLLSIPSREQRVGLFLDKLESRSDRAFVIFMEILRENYKQLHYVMEESLRNIGELHHSEHRERVAISGEAVRKLLKNNLKRKVDHSHGSESAEDLDLYFNDRDDSHYIDCYAIPMRGKLQKESWIKQISDPRSASSPVKSAKDDDTYMAMLTKDIVFKKIDIGAIPETVQLPPTQCSAIYVVDDDKQDTTPNTEDEDADTEQDPPPPPVPAPNKRGTLGAPLELAPPPPLPPKPDGPLPGPPSLKARAVPTKTDKKPETKPDTEAKPLPTKDSVKDKPTTTAVKPKLPGAKEDSNSEPPKGSPPLPPRLPPTLPPTIPPRRPSFRKATGVDVDESADTSSSSSTKRETSEEPVESTEEDQSSAQTLCNELDDDPIIPVADDSPEEEYECVNQSQMIRTLPRDNSSSSKLDAASRESTPGDPDTSRDQSTQDESSKASADSMDGIVAGDRRSVTTDSGVDASTPLPPIPQQVKSPPRNLSDVQVFAGDISSDSDSYYEDIDVGDAGKGASGGPASSPSRSSLMYLDPRAYAKSFDKGGPQDHKRTSMKRKAEPDWESLGKFKLWQNDLVIANVEPVYRAGENSLKTDLTLSSDKTDVVKSQGDVATETGQTGDDTEATGSVSEDSDPLSKFVDTTMVFDKVGRVFYIPKDLLRKHGTPDGQPWFYPIEISSRQATLFLSGEKQEGCFLVYSPTNKVSGAVYNLSVCRGNGDVVHYHILENIHGDVMIEGHDHSFLNIQDLVNYFKRNKSQLATRLGRPLKESTLAITPGHQYDTKWEINRSHLTISGKIVGKGNYGVVCAGTYHSLPVAVKVLQKVDATVGEEDEFIEEACTLGKLRHDHIVRLVGLSCMSKPFFLVTEYMPKGNLRECLQKDEVPRDNIDTLFDICIQTSAAMSYLEGKQYVLHRDLAARNFLVTEDRCVKLADFGRARYVSDDNYQAPRMEKVSVKWSAPEVLLESSYSTKSDVWALGVVFWEIFSGGEQPYESLSGEHTAIYVTEGGRLDKPPGCAPDLFSMMKSCWRDLPDDRPSFAVLYDKLKSKSSIYYSREPLRAGPRVPRTRANDEIQLPRSTSSSRASRGSGGEKDSVKDSPVAGQKYKPAVPAKQPQISRRTVSIDGRMDEFYGNQSLGNIREENRGGALTNSSSETSLVSGADLLDKDDLKRGNKIRKSLRKIMNMKPRRKGTKLDGLTEWTQGEPSYAHQYGPS